MGEVLPRNIIISLVLVMFVLTAGIFIIKGTYTGIGVETPTYVTDIENNISGTQTAIQAFADETKTTFDDESKKGWVSSACTSLLGDDNFFCAGIDTLGQITKAPENLRLTVNVFSKSFPVEIPAWVVGTFITILTTIIVFVGLSAYRRYKS